MAKLSFFYGSMNSGKSTRVIQCAYSYQAIKKKIVLMKPIVDTKGGNKVTSRIGAEREVDVSIKKNDDIYNLVVEAFQDCKLILVDEAQFLTEEQVNELSDIATELNIPVMCYGIRTDFLTHSFPGSRRLLEIADKLEEVKVICPCGERKALFNIRFQNGEVVKEGESISIDGEESITYNISCAKCYKKVLGKPFRNI